MTAILVSGISGIEDVLDALDPKDRQNLERRAVRAGAKPIAEALRRVAGSSQVPRSFSAATPAKMVKVTTHGGAGRAVAAIVRPPSPLFNIFQPGASAHTIAPRASAGVLGGPAGSGSWDNAGRKRADAFFSAGPVQHPGMAARDLIGPAFAESAAAATDAVARVIFGSRAGA